MATCQDLSLHKRINANNSYVMISRLLIKIARKVYVQALPAPHLRPPDLCPPVAAYHMLVLGIGAFERKLRVLRYLLPLVRDLLAQLVHLSELDARHNTCT